ncbi:MAG: metal ABC transporter ATP-binding protein [Nitrososphaera sp.]
MHAVSVEKVTYDYGQGLALDSISFTVDEGDLLGIIGPNGAGKTTLFNCMLGLIDDYQGAITVFGQDIRKDNSILRQIGYVQQKKSIEQNFPATVEEVVSLGAVSKKPSKEKILAALETVGMAELRNRRIGELSGGQQQRVLIAKALVNEPRLLILDEPVTGIDKETQNKFYALVQKINKENKITIIWSSHDLDAIQKLANKVACINRDMFFHGQAGDFFGDEEMVKKYSEASMQKHMHLHSH